MNKIYALIPLVFFLISCTPQAPENTYRFGIILPLTGDNSFYGEFYKYGVEAAIEDINAQGGIRGKQVVAIYEDTGSNKAQANNAAQKLLETDRVDGLFSVTTPISGVVAPLAESSQTPLIYLSATNSFTQDKKYVFKDYIDAANACEILMKAAREQGHIKVALFGTNAEFTQLCEEGAKRVGTLALYEIYNAGETDFRTTFVKILNSGATALILSVFANDCPNVFQQMAELNYKPQLYVSFQSFGCGSPDNTKRFPNLLAGSYGADIFVDQQDSVFENFQKRLVDKGWTTQIVGSALAYDGVMQMTQAHKDCEDKACVTDQLRKLNMKGLTGTIHYDGGQIINRAVMLTKYDQGKWVKG